MDKQQLGALEVSGIGLGCMGLSTNYGEPVDADHGMQLIRTAHDLGVTFFDTAEPFANETLVGQALAPSVTRSLSPRSSGSSSPRPDVSTANLTISARWSSRCCNGRVRTDPHRPALPAPRRPGGADRGRRRHRQGFDR